MKAVKKKKTLIVITKTNVEFPLKIFFFEICQGIEFHCFLVFTILFPLSTSLFFFSRLSSLPVVQMHGIELPLLPPKPCWLGVGGRYKAGDKVGHYCCFYLLFGSLTHSSLLCMNVGEIKRN